MTENNISESTGTSIFDPVICEIIYKWFCPPGGTIVDPFAGGSVRGIVAAYLGFQYVGVDLRREQIDANDVNAADVLGESEIYPAWHCGDSMSIDNICTGMKADIIFSCPPYGDLEVYSDDENDLSNMEHESFIEKYGGIIKKSVGLLNENRFACFVVSDFRDKNGFYRNFVSDTIKAFIDAGMMLYNEIVLVNAIGSLPIRVGRQFSGYRKVGKTHQNILVFYKGDPKQIKANFPEIDIKQFESATAPK